MSNESVTIVQRLWNYCNVLRDDVKFDDALARSERLRHAAPERGAILKQAFEGKLV